MRESRGNKRNVSTSLSLWMSFGCAFLPSLPQGEEAGLANREMNNIFVHVMLSRMDPVFGVSHTFTFSSRLSRSEVWVISRGGAYPVLGESQRNCVPRGFGNVTFEKKKNERLLGNIAEESSNNYLCGKTGKLLFFKTKEQCRRLWKLEKIKDLARGK